MLPMIDQEKLLCCMPHVRLMLKNSTGTDTYDLLLKIFLKNPIAIHIFNWTLCNINPRQHTLNPLHTSDPTTALSLNYSGFLGY